MSKQSSLFKFFTPKSDSKFKDEAPQKRKTDKANEQVVPKKPKIERTIVPSKEKPSTSNADNNNNRNSYHEDTEVSQNPKDMKNAEICDPIITSVTVPNQIDSTDDKDMCSTDNKASKEKHVFLTSWLTRHEWLTFSAGMMFCKVCKSQGKISQFTTGSTNFRTTTLDRHVQTADHRAALRESVQRGDFQKATVTALTKKEDAIEKSMRNVYWIGKELLPMSKFPSLQELCALQGVDMGSLNVHGQTYSSRATGDEFLESISYDLKRQIEKEMAAANFLAVMFDESTDITVNKKMLVYVRYVQHDMEIKTQFLGNILIAEPHVDSKLLLQYVVNYLQQRGVNSEKIFSVGTDGAAIMLGKKKGVVTQLKSQNPFIVSIHCLAHRLNLATSKAAKEVEYIGKCEKILTDIFYHFRKSSARTLSLKAIQRVLDLPEVKTKEVYDIRWCAFYDALCAVYRSWPALVRYFQEEVAKKKPKKKGSKSSEKKKKVQEPKQGSKLKTSSKKPSTSSKESEKTSEGASDSEKPSFRHAKTIEELEESVCNFKFLAVVHLLMDVIPSITRLNLIFQKEDIDIAAIAPAIESVQTSLNKAAKNDGFHQKEFKNKLKKKDGKQMCGETEIKFRSYYPEQVEEIRKDFVAALKSNIESRFPSDSCDIVNSFEVMSLRGLGLVPDEEVFTFGNEKMETLLNHYGEEKTSSGGNTLPPVVNDNATRLEWTALKEMVRKEKYPSNSIQLLWKLIKSHHNSSFPNLIRLAEIALILPLHTADVERGFSTQNLIHTKLRNCLSGVNLDHLMTVKLVGPPIDKYDFQRAIAVWKCKKNRSIFQK